MACGCGSSRGKAAAKIAMSVIGSKCTDAATVRHRREVCAKCERAKNIAGALPICGECGCVIWAKTRLKGETCPDGRW